METSPAVPPPAVNGQSHLTPEAQGGASARLHGQKPPKYELQTEESWHRAAAMMFARGEVTQKEVAEAFRVDPGTIRNLMRQPWFQEKVTELMLEYGGRDIMVLFKAEAFNSLITMVQLREDIKTPPAVKRQLCVDILDRGYGKPVQKVETSDSSKSNDPVAEVARLEEANRRDKEALFGNRQDAATGLGERNNRVAGD